MVWGARWGQGVNSLASPLSVRPMLGLLGSVPWEGDPGGQSPVLGPNAALAAWHVYAGTCHLPSCSPHCSLNSSHPQSCCFSSAFGEGSSPGLFFRALP